MARQSLSTEAIVLGTHPPGDSFARIDLFSPTHGALLAYQRVSRKVAPLDLFDRAQLELDAAPQGEAWFLREARLVGRAEGIAKSYEALRHASLLARAVLANPVPDESRQAVFNLLIQCLRSFGMDPRPDVTLFKGLFLLVRDEGYPLRQQWLPTLGPVEQQRVQEVLSKPLREQTLDPVDVRRLLRKFSDYLAGHTELRLPGLDAL